MMKVQSGRAPTAVGPYSQAILSGDLVFVSGQLGMDKEGRFGKDVAEQTALALKNLEEILLASGSDLSQVVKTTCFLAHIEDFARFNEVYARFITEKPARSLIQAAALPKGSLVEIEAIAERKA